MTSIQIDQWRMRMYRVCMHHMMIDQSMIVNNPYRIAGMLWIH
jgi:hypothetical protein